MLGNIAHSKHNNITETIMAKNKCWHLAASRFKRKNKFSENETVPLIKTSIISTACHQNAIERQ